MYTFEQKLELLSRANNIEKTAIAPLIGAGLLAGGTLLGGGIKWGLERMGFTNPNTPAPASKAVDAVSGAANTLTNKTKNDGWFGSLNPFNTVNKAIKEAPKPAAQPTPTQQLGK